MRAQFDRRRRYVVERLAKMPGVSLDAVPEGAFYIFARVSDLYGEREATPAMGGSMDFAERLLEEGRVAVVPGLPFGSDNHVRLSYSDSLERLAEGMDRLERFVRSVSGVDAAKR
jgi:aspartate aminotransferase